MKSQSMTSKLQAYRTLIYNCQDPIILALLTPYGITETDLEEGKSLYERTMQLFDTQRTEYQEQELAYDQYTVKKDSVSKMFNKTLKLVKLFSRKDPALQDRLKLTTGQAKAIEEWIDTASALYVRLENESDFVASLLKRGITPESLSDEKAEIESLRTLRDKATAEKGQAQEATRLRNEKMDELQDFAFELKELATIAIGNNSQLLEKLGITVR